jgi:hypothetical protein
VSPLRQATHEQRLWKHAREDAFGLINVPNPRWNRCACRTDGPKIPSDENLAQRANQPGNAVLGDEVGLIDPFVRTADLLKEVLPVGESVNPETVRNHLQLTAGENRMKAVGIRNR